jgi:hypothetical protein
MFIIFLLIVLASQISFAQGMKLEKIWEPPQKLSGSDFYIVNDTFYFIDGITATVYIVDIVSKNYKTIPLDSGLIVNAGEGFDGFYLFYLYKVGYYGPWKFKRISLNGQVEDISYKLRSKYVFCYRVINKESNNIGVLLHYHMDGVIYIMKGDSEYVYQHSVGYLSKAFLYNPIDSEYIFIWGGTYGFSPYPAYGVVEWFKKGEVREIDREPLIRGDEAHSGDIVGDKLFVVYAVDNSHLKFKAFNVYSGKLFERLVKAPTDSMEYYTGLYLKMINDSYGYLSFNDYKSTYILNFTIDSGGNVNILNVIKLPVLSYAPIEVYKDAIYTIIRGTIYRINKVTSVENKEIPTKFALYQNYPNPFNPSTTISYDLPVRAHVKLTVYNILGQEVATLVDKEQEPGRYNVKFDASGLPSGIYFYTLQTPYFTKTNKMVLVK